MDLSCLWQSREVKVGSVGVGGKNPIRIQSMTTTKTDDWNATIDQIIRLADKGCEIVRVTVQGMKEAAACEKIKNGLVVRGYTIPLVADIHFFPKAAIEAAEFVDKVRINPGNFADMRATFNKVEIDEESWNRDLQRIEEKFTPLVEKCKRLKRALRLGVNHGSLSDRIMSHFGDSPKGMVTSAIEFAEIARKLNFHDLVFSMKASNPKVMIEAYRLLVLEMMGRGWNYPLHLGVTEAGEGEDGRIKSAIGMGTLLLDGIGDTIRLSLTEDPECEIDPAMRLVKMVERSGRTKATKEIVETRLRSYPSVQSNGKGEEIEVDEDQVKWEMLKKVNPSRIFFRPKKNRVHSSRDLVDWLNKNKIRAPLTLRFSYDVAFDDLVLSAASELGSLLIDGIGDAIEIEGDYPPEAIKELSSSILQAAGRLLYKTEYISCPGCGRTLFDIQKVTREIKEKTSHLPGVKIAIMGCIVNGPGEMADAHFGYVGSRPGKVDLYLGKVCVEREIEMDNAVERLIDLIRREGKWVNPSSQNKNGLPN